MKFALSILFIVSALTQEPNPPNWDTQRVKIIDPNDPQTAQTIVDQIFSENGGQNPPCNGHWSNSRYAVMFKPGEHHVNVNVGFYTQVLGLGRKPQDTKIQSVICENGDFNPDVGALDNFWRGIENFYTKPKDKMIWAVSQSSPMRRIYIEGDIDLFQQYPGQHPGWSSGGFMADSHITGTVFSGSQQQFIARNVVMKSWPDGNWNMVFVGSQGAPLNHCSNSGGIPTTTVDTTPVIAEKPYIVLEGNSYLLMIPRVEVNKVGHTEDFENADAVDFSQVYVASQSDSVATINQKLEQGLHLVLQPGNYYLDDAIKVNRANTVVLGLGLATLISNTGKPCIEVGNVDGVRVAGLLLQSGPIETMALLKWGEGKYEGSAANPGFMQDVFVRVGGTNDPNVQEMKATYMMQVNSGHVIIDDTWLWRADHGVYGLISNSKNPVISGIQVNGDNVIAYGLASEHTLGHLVEWNGNNGQTYFYQSEYAYDVNQENYGNKGFVSYYVADHVTNHVAYGLGIYSYFRDYQIVVNSGIKSPSGPGIKFINSLTVWLNGNGEISHVINNIGQSVNRDNRLCYVCNFPQQEEQQQDLWIITKWNELLEKIYSNIPFLQ